MTNEETNSIGAAWLRQFASDLAANECAQAWGVEDFVHDLGDYALDVQRGRITLDLEPHRTTDPACEFHTAPSTPDERRRFDQARGKSCRACLS